MHVYKDKVLDSTFQGSRTAKGLRGQAQYAQAGPSETAAEEGVDAGRTEPAGRTTSRGLSLSEAVLHRS